MNIQRRLFLQKPSYIYYSNIYLLFLDLKYVSIFNRKKTFVRNFSLQNENRNIFIRKKIYVNKFSFIQTLPDNGRLSIYQSLSIYQQLSICQQRGTCITPCVCHTPDLYLARVKDKTQKSFYTRIDFCNTLLTNKTLFLCYNVIVNKVPLDLYLRENELRTKRNSLIDFKINKFLAFIITDLLQIKVSSCII